MNGINSAIPESFDELEYLKLIFDFNPCLICITDLETGVFLDANKSFMGKLGYQKHELLGSSPSKINLFKRRSDLDIFLEQIKEKKEVENYEILVQDKHGKPLYISLSSKIILLKKRPCILSAGIDMSDKKIMEDEFNESVFYSYSLNMLINEISTELIQCRHEDIESTIDITLKKIGSFSNVDRVYIFEFSDGMKCLSNTYEWCEEGIKSQKDQLKNISSTTIKRWIECFNEKKDVYIYSVSEIPDEYALEKESLASQDIKSLLAIPMIYSGKIIGFLGFDSVKDYRFWDQSIINMFSTIAEILAATLIKRDYEKELISARDIAQRADKRKGEFLASMSHEVRNPVSVIIGLSELLNLRINDPKEKEYINGIMVNGRNLLKLLNDILDLSKIDAGKTVIHTQKIDLSSFLSEFEQIYGMQFKDKNISFILKKHPDLPQNIWADEVRLRQILMNIIGNSGKFTYEGYVTLEAKLMKVSNEYGDMCFEISDSGIGISQENIEKLFEAFSQNPDQDRKYGGTGLGLSISKKLVELMGGHISVQSTQGVGTKVTITLHGIKYSDTARN